MSVRLTPDLAPITTGTYFPPDDQWGMPGFKSVLLSIAKKWQDKRSELSKTGRSIIDAMRKGVTERDPSTLAEPTTVEVKFDQAIRIISEIQDDVWGGFGTKPKFPEVSKLKLSDAATLDIVMRTKAAITITCLAVLQAIRSIVNGTFHILRKCYTIKANC